MIYDEANFPNLDSLAIIRNMHGQEDINLRAFRLIEITGKIINHKTIDKVYYCNPSEAVSVVKSITKHNWLYGFWGITALFANIRAILRNLLHINDPKENLTLLIHNALAYQSEGKQNNAALCAVLAKQYAKKEELPYINQYVNMLGTVSLPSILKWNFNKLIKIQLIYIFVLFFVIFILFSFLGISTIRKNKKESSEIKQVIIFKDGKKAFSDVSVAKIFDLAVDVYDKERLYHVTKRTTARHGADKSFDVYKIIEEGTTVRLTGYTIDGKWMRVMFDNGEMAFIESSKLEKGIGNDIPLWSKIYKEK